MGQPVDSEKEDEGGEGASGTDDEEGEADGDTSAGRGGEDGGNDGEAVAEEDSASLVHPVTKVTFDLMRKLRELPISGGSFGAAALFFSCARLRLWGWHSALGGRAAWAVCSDRRLSWDSGVWISYRLWHVAWVPAMWVRPPTPRVLFSDVSGRLLTQLLRECACCSHVPPPLVCA